MRGLTKLLVLLIVSGTFYGCTSGQPKLTAKQLAARHAKSLEDAGLKYYWKSSDVSELMQGGEKIAKTYLLDENLYCLTTMNRLIAIDAASGTLQWSRWVHVADPGKKVFDPIHVDQVMISRDTPTRKEVLQPKKGLDRNVKPVDLLIISTRTNALVLDRKNGVELRNIKFTFGASATAGVASNGKFLFVPDSKGWYHAIFVHEMLKTWTLAVEGAIRVPPVYVADKVIVASEDGHVQVARTFETRKKLWARSLGAGVDAPIVATPTHLLIPCMDRRLHAFDTITGQRLWEAFDCKKPLKQVPQITEVSVFQYAQGGEFYALDLVSGKLRWSLPNARKILAAMNNNVYLQDNTNKILLADEILGEVQASVQMPPRDLLAANTSAPAIFGASRDGNIYCIRRLDAGHITAEMLRKKADK